jgi:hypothetical protein
MHVVIYKKNPPLLFRRREWENTGPNFVFGTAVFRMVFCGSPEENRKPYSSYNMSE